MYSNTNSYENPSIRSRDMTKVIVTFRNSANASKNRSHSQIVTNTRWKHIGRGDEEILNSP